MSFTSVLTGEARGAFHELRVLKNGVMQDVLTLLSDDELESKIDTLIGAGAVVVSGSGSSRTITVDLADYATTASVISMLSGKVSSVKAGSGITIGGTSTDPTISALSLQRDGVSVSHIDTIDVLSAISTTTGSKLSIGPPLFQHSVNLGGSNASSLVLSRSGNDLSWNSAILASQTWTNTQLATKLDSTGVQQIAFNNGVDPTRALSINDDLSLAWGGHTLVTDGQISYYSQQASSETVILQGTHIAWTYTSGANNTATSHQTLTQGSTTGSYKICTDAISVGPANVIVLLQVYMKAGTTDRTIISINDAATWSGYQEKIVSGLSTSAFSLVTWSFTVPANRTINLHVGYVPNGSSSTQTAGTIHIRDLKMYRTAPSTTISTDLQVSGDLILTGSISAANIQALEARVAALES